MSVLIANTVSINTTKINKGPLQSLSVKSIKGHETKKLKNCY